MKDFEGKILKVYLDNIQGWLALTGYFIRYEDNFFIIKESMSKKIKYLNKDFIKSIEIVGDIEDE